MLTLSTHPLELSFNSVPATLMPPIPITMTDTVYTERDLPNLQLLLSGIDTLSEKSHTDPNQGATAPHLSRLTGLKLEYVKKKLKVLQANGLIEPLGYTPKQYRLNTYHLAQRLDEPDVAPFVADDSPYRVAALLQL